MNLTVPQAPESTSPVILSAAKDLAAPRGGVAIGGNYQTLRCAQGDSKPGER
ncbi:MAG: hypothetical protein ACJ797_01885 [Ktedonobacteraceae bacterium]